MASSWLRSLQGQLTEFASEVMSEATQEVEDPGSELQVLRKKVAEAEKELLSEKSNGEILKKKISELEEELHIKDVELDAFNEKLTSMVDSRDQQIKSLQIELERARNTANDALFDDEDEEDFMPSGISKSQRMREEITSLKKEVAHWKRIVSESQQGDQYKKTLELEQKLDEQKAKYQSEITSLIMQHNENLAQIRSEYEAKVVDVKLSARNAAAGDWNRKGSRQANDGSDNEWQNWGDESATQTSASEEVRTNEKEVEIDRLKEDNNRLMEERNTLLEKIKAAQLENATKDAEVDRLTLEAVDSLLNERVADAQRERDEYKAKFDSIAKEVNEKNIELEKKEEELKLKNSENQRMEMEIKELTAAYNELNEEFEADKAEHGNMSRSNRELTTRIDSLKANLIEYEERYEMCKAENAETVKQLEKLTKDFERLRMTFETSKIKSSSDAVEEMEKLRAELDSSKDDRDRLREDVDKFRSAIGSIDSELIRLRESNERLARDNQAMGQSLDRFADIRNMLEKSDQELKFLQEKFLHLQEEDERKEDEWRKQVSAISEARDSLQRELAEAQSKNVELESALERYRAAIGLHHAVNVGLDDEHHDQVNSEMKASGSEGTNDSNNGWEKMAAESEISLSSEVVSHDGAALMEELREALAMITEKTEECEELRRAKNAIQKELEVRQNCVDEVMMQNSSLQREQQIQAESYRDLRAWAAEKEKEKLEVERKLVHTEEKLALAEANLNTVTQESNQAKLQLIDALKRFDKEAASLLTYQNKDIQVNDNDFVDESGDDDPVESQLKRLNEANSKLKSDYECLLMEKTDTVSSLAVCREEISRLQKENDSLKESLETTEKDLEAYAAEVKTLKKDKELLEESVLRAEKALAELDSIKEGLMNVKQDAAKDVAGRMQLLESSNQDLRNQLDEVNRIIIRDRQRYEEVISQSDIVIEELRKEITTLRNQEHIVEDVMPSEPGIQIPEQLQMPKISSTVRENVAESGLNAEQTEYERFEAEKAKLIKRVTDAEKSILRIEKCQTELNNAREENVRLAERLLAAQEETEKFERMREDFAKLEEERSSLAQQLSIAQQDLSALSDLRSELRTLELEKADMKAKIAAMLKEVHDASSQTETVREEKRNAEKENEMVAQIENLKAELSRMDSERSEQQQANEKLINDMSNLNATLTESERIRTELVSLVEQKHAESVQFHGQLQAVIAEQREKDSVTAALSGKCVDLERELQSVNEGREKINRECARLREHLLEIEDSYTKEAMAAEERETELRKRIKDLELKSEKSEDTVTASSSSFQCRISELSNELDAVKSERNTFRQTLMERENALIDAQKALSNLQAVLKDLSADHDVQVAEYQSVIEKLRNDFQVMREEASKMKAKEQLLVTEKQSLEDITSNLKQELSKRDAAIEELEAQIDERSHPTALFASSSTYHIDDETLRQLFLSYFTAEKDRKPEIAMLLASVLGYSQEDVEKIQAANQEASRGWFGLGGVSRPARNTPSIAEQFIRFLETESISASATHSLPVRDTPGTSTIRSSEFPPTFPPDDSDLRSILES